MRYALAVMIVLFASATVHAGEVYIWKDKDGVVHMTNRDTSDTPKEKVYLPENGPPDKAYYDRQDRALRSMVREQEAREAALERERAHNERQEDLERKARERQKKQEIAEARRDYEWNKAREEEWKAAYHGADYESGRLFWKRKLRELAQSREKLMNLTGEQIPYTWEP